MNLIRYHGVLAPNAKWRSQIVPSPIEQDGEGIDEAGHVAEVICVGQERKGGGRYISWSRLLRRVFDLDMEECPKCGGQVKIIAAIEDPAPSRKF